MADVEIRAFQPGDYERLATIWNANFPENNVSPNEMRHDDETYDTTKYILKQFTAVKSGRMIAWAAYLHMQAMFHPKKFIIHIVVDPAEQRSGVGSALYEHVMEELGSLKAILARARVREDMAASVSFLENRGFVELNRMWESRLAVREFPPTKFLRYAQRAASSGVTITTLAEEARTDPNAYRKLHELWMGEIAQDLPLPDTFTPVSFENFMKQVIEGPNLLPDGCFIAKVGDRYVGLSSSGKSEREPTDLYQWLTGTLREYRGRGIAIALKLRVIDFAKRNRYEVIKAWNDSANVGMLAINQKLGFRRHVGWILYEKPLNSEAASN